VIVENDQFSLTTRKGGPSLFAFVDEECSFDESSQTISLFLPLHSTDISTHSLLAFFSKISQLLPQHLHHLCPKYFIK